jgi:hypothetical protein
VRKSANALADRVTNEGLDKESSEVDNTWINIPRGQLKTDCNHPTTKDHEGSLSIEGHIEEDITRPLERYASPRQNMTT